MRFRIRAVGRTRAAGLTFIGVSTGLLLITSAAAGGTSPFTIRPSHPTSHSTITITFKVPKKLPKGRHWLLGMGDHLATPQTCASFEELEFDTRGKKGEVLKATFRPQDDVVDTHPTAWCTGSAGASSYGVFAASHTPNGGHFHILVSRFRLFTIS